MSMTDLPETNPADEQSSGRRLPILPLPDGVVVPDMVVTVTMQSAEARHVLRAAADGQVLLVPRIDGAFAQVGVIATIEDRQSGRPSPSRSGAGRPGADQSGNGPEEDTPIITLRAHERAQIGAGVIGATGGLWVEVDPVVEPRGDDLDDETRHLARTYRAAASELLDRVGGRRMIDALPPVAQPGALADSIAYWPDLTLERRVELLETIDVAERLRLATGWVTEKLAEIEVRDKINRDVSEDLESTQREAILRRQMAAIQSELGQINGDGDDAVARYRSELDELVAAEALTTAVAEAITSEIDRLERSGGGNAESVEANWIRTWLDAVFGIPWSERSNEQLDLEEARAILDTDHTGLDDVKERLAEYLAVRKLRHDRGVTDDPGTRRGGVILALVGPPGVGKTSLGESVARALGRKFVRLALGGIRDEAEIRGHRRTYVGSRPGRLVAALAEAGSMNPVILLDEIDKVSGGWQGDPSAALLEVLDPAQNHSFRDHYLEFELDLSDVIFIATANVIETIPGPLLDRLEIIPIDGYTEVEKATIARQHLLPRLEQRTGLEPGEVHITDDALAGVVGQYTREAGVRRLERLLDKLLRKTVTKIASRPAPDEDVADRITIDTADLSDLLGKPIPDEEVRGRIDRPGIATGLAVTGAGGDVLFVETALVDGEGEPILTGQLGEVMKESATIVSTVVANRAEQLGAAFPEGKRLHVHFPAGAVPKDGPSAGVTMTTALTSLLTGRPVRDDLAMTGEVTLQGRVLPIGGVKQKVLAAHRAGLQMVLLPKGNEPDLADIPETVAEALDIRLVGDIDQLLELALDDRAAPPSRS